VFGGSPITLYRTENARMQGELQVAAGVAQQTDRTTTVRSVSNEKRMMALSVRFEAIRLEHWPV
jgi:hypothetical protein